jgi:hypothetical protein
MTPHILKLRLIKRRLAGDFSLAYTEQDPRRYPYFDVVVGLVWSHDPKSYADGSVCYW